MRWVKVKVAQSYLTLCKSAGQNTGVGSLSLRQGIFPTQGLNPGLPHCRQILYQLSYKGSPRILEWVFYPFSSGYSRPRNWIGVSCIAGGFFIYWAIRAAQEQSKIIKSYFLFLPPPPFLWYSILITNIIFFNVCLHTIKNAYISTKKYIYMI